MMSGAVCCGGEVIDVSCGRAVTPEKLYPVSLRGGNGQWTLNAWCSGRTCFGGPMIISGSWLPASN